MLYLRIFSRNRVWRVDVPVRRSTMAGTGSMPGSETWLLAQHMLKIGAVSVPPVFLYGHIFFRQLGYHAFIPGKMCRPSKICGPRTRRCSNGTTRATRESEAVGCVDNGQKTLELRLFPGRPQVAQVSSFVVFVDVDVFGRAWRRVWRTCCLQSPCFVVYIYRSLVNVNFMGNMSAKSVLPVCCILGT